MRKIVQYVLIVLIAIGIFMFGFMMGTKFFLTIKSTTMLQDIFIESTKLMSVLNYLDKGDVEKAREFLVLMQDAAVLEIDSLAKYADKQSYETACNIMLKIARHRRENPEKYVSYTKGLKGEHVSDIHREIAKILHNWESCKNRNNSD